MRKRCSCICCMEHLFSRKILGETILSGYSFQCNDSMEGESFLMIIHLYFTFIFFYDLSDAL